MSFTETNVFRILNLSDLSSRYRLYRIRGLRGDHAEYFRNRDAIARRLSYGLKTAAIVIERDGQPHLVLPEEAPTPPASITVVRATVYFDEVPGLLDLDYRKRSEDNDAICLRFIHSAVQNALWANRSIWQPSRGEAFFERTPERRFREIDLFAGFAIRPIICGDGGIALCVDKRSKFVSAQPLAADIDRDGFRRLKGRSFVYHYGHQWYEVRLSELSDLNATEHLYCFSGSETS